MKIETLTGPNGQLYDAYVVPQPDGGVFYVDANLANRYDDPEAFVMAEVELLTRQTRKPS